MKNVKKILAAVIVAGAASLAFAAPANADSVHVSLNLGNNGGYYRPAPAPVVYRPAPVRQAVVYRPAPRVVYVQPRRWEPRGHWSHRNDNRGRMAYGYGRGW